MFLATLVVWSFLFVCSATAELGLVEPLHNAQHIFNAIQSSMGQWGSSINHNGMSFFLATVPQGVHLHHGAPRGAPVKGMEWLAFEPEHAIRFAWNIDECSGSQEQAMDSQRSLKWVSPQYLHLFYPPETPQQDDQKVLKPPRKPPPFCFEPGYLHTYATSRDLNLLYIDGESAAKSLNGTLDSQDYILLHDSPRRRFFDDWNRANDLCYLARTTWKGKIDGFIRMEHGFEIVLCDFDDLDVVSILDADQPFEDAISSGWEYKMAGEHFNFFSAITSRYSGIGGDRVKIHYNEFITAYNYPDLDLFPSDSKFPRLTSISNHSAQQILSDITSLILFREPRTPAPDADVDWQAIATLLATRYSHHLQLFTTSDGYPNSTTLAYAIRLLLSPYISHNHRNNTIEIHRCTFAFLPYHLHPLQPSQQSLAQRAFLTVSHKLCSTLHSVLTVAEHRPNTTLPELQNPLKELMIWLAWPEFKYCQPSCALDEVCFTAIWPWGSAQDIERPRCANGSWILRRIGDWDMGHWGKEETQTPSLGTER